MSGTLVTLIGPDAEGRMRLVEIDHFLGLQGATDFDQMAVSQGIYYTTHRYAAAVADDGVVEILVTTSASSTVEAVGLGVQVSAGGNALLTIYDTPTVSNNGTALSLFQVNGNSANTASSNAYHTPTTSADGTNIFHLLLPGGAVGHSVGSTSSPFQRIMMAPSTTFLIRAQNISGQVAEVCINVNLIELPADTA